jgi:hypothetical protein
MRAVVALLACSLVACGKPSKQAPIAAAVEKLADAPSRMVLYSLHPGEPADYKDIYDDHLFHGFIILGKAGITDPSEQQALLRALARGVRENDGEEGLCFVPRHALHIEKGVQSVDFTICFHCLQVETRGFDPKSFFTSASPEPVFDSALQKHHLPMPPR